jgi:ABC-2 type transport system permease protein
MMSALLRLTLRQMTSRRRLAVLVLLAALPVSLSIVLSLLVTDDPEFNSHFIPAVLDGMLIGAVVPIAVMALATAAFGNELEDRTLNVLVLKPVPRLTIALAKMGGSVLIALPLVVGAGVAVVLIAVEGAGVRAVLATVAAVGAGGLAYAALFTWAGLLSSRALGFGIVYVFLWEGLISSFLGGVRYLSVRGYTLGLLNGLDPQTFAVLDGRVIELPAAIGGAVVAVVLFVGLTVRRLQRMDVP